MLELPMADGLKRMTRGEGQLTFHLNIQRSRLCGVVLLICWPLNLIHVTLTTAPQTHLWEHSCSIPRVFRPLGGLLGGAGA